MGIPKSDRRPRPNVKKVPRAPKDERTKFDKWLEEQATNGVPVEFVFKVDPFSIGYGVCRLECVILTVDRYNVYLTHREIDPTWVAKDNIIAAC